MRYKWVSDGAEYLPTHNKKKPWAVEYNSDHYGVKYFSSLHDALDWISSVECDQEFPF